MQAPKNDKLVFLLPMQQGQHFFFFFLDIENCMIMHNGDAQYIGTISVIG